MRLVVVHLRARVPQALQVARDEVVVACGHAVRAVGWLVCRHRWNRMRYYVGLLGLVIGYLGLAACATSDPVLPAAPVRAAPPHLGARLIVKFRAVGADP